MIQLPQPVRLTTWPATTHLLAATRHQARTSQNAIAALLHCSHTAISMWEQNQRTPAADDFLAWCRVLGFDIILIKRQPTLTGGAGQ